jgi:peptide/nickel transport system permease protein
MFAKIKIWHTVVALSSIIFALKLELVIDILKLLQTESGNYFSILSILHLEKIGIILWLITRDSLKDGYSVSALLLFLFPFLAVLFRNKDFLKSKAGFNSLILLFLLYTFVFAPLITSTHPDYQKDLSVTKLLPPLTTVKVIRQYFPLSEEDSLKLRIVKQSTEESNKLTFADSVKYKNGGLYYYQAGNEYQYPAAEKEYAKIVDLQFGKILVGAKEGFPVREIYKKTYLLGTDEFGRDVFSRLVYGTRISLIVGLGAVAVTLLLGVIFGFIAGYFGGITDIILNRLSDMLLAFPAIFLIILLVALFGNSLWVVIIVLGYSGWMSLFKIVRDEVISIKNKDYFISAGLAGLSHSKLLLKEVMPVILTPVIVNLVLQYGNAILAEAALSFLGLGTGYNYPSWGGMIESGQQYLEQAWWIMLFPGLALVITLFTANNIGKEINSFYNPRLKND